VRVVYAIESAACFSLFGYGMAEWRYLGRERRILVTGLCALALGFLLLVPDTSPWLSIATAILVVALGTVVITIFRRVQREDDA
jgi:membrane protein implicated in regulation of membrane protease activity